MSTAQLIEIAQLVIAVGVAIGLPVIIWQVQALVSGRIKNERLGVLSSIVSDAVTAAEGVFSEPKSGEQKKQYVMNIARWAVDTIGVKVSDELLDTMVEAAVFVLFNDEGRIDDGR